LLLVDYVLVVYLLFLQSPKDSSNDK